MYTDGRTRTLKRIIEVKVGTLHGQVSTLSRENLFPEKEPSLRSSGEPDWGSKDQLQLEDGAADLDR